MRTKLREFLKTVELKTQKAGDMYKETKFAAEEIAKSAAASPSQAGDSFHARGSADLAKQKYEVLLQLKHELKKAIILNPPDKIKPTCFVNLAGEGYYLLENPVAIVGAKLVSVASSFGQKLMGKGVGDTVNGKEVLEIG